MIVQAPEKDRRVRGSAVLIIAVGVVCYLNSFSAPFVYDGVPFVRDNPAIREPWRLDRIFAFSPGRWFCYWTFSLNYFVHGSAVWGYHAVNLVIHVFNACLLFGIVRRTLRLPTLGFAADRADWVGLIVSLLWIAHPLNTQAVTNIYQRHESLASMFTLGTVYAFCQALACNSRQSRWATLSVVSCWLGTAVKEFVVLTPIIVFAYDYVYLRLTPVFRQRRRYYAMLMLVVPFALSGLYLQSPHFADGGILFVENISVGDYLSNQPEVLLHYLRLVVWPVNLCFDYAWPRAGSFRQVVVASTVVMSAVSLMLYGVVRRRTWSVPAVAFFVLLAPSSSFIPIVDLAVEHRMYLPSSLVIAGLVIIVLCLGHRFNQEYAVLTNRAYACLTILTLAMLTGLTICRNQVYRSELALWSDVLEVAPHNARAHINLGVQFKQRRDYSTAEVHLLEALRIEPRSVLAHYNIGTLYFVQRRYVECDKHLTRALELRPRDALNLSALGMLRGMQGRLAESEMLFRESLVIDPANPTNQKHLRAVLAATPRARPVPDGTSAPATP